MEPLQQAGILGAEIKDQGDAAPAFKELAGSCYPTQTEMCLQRQVREGLSECRRGREEDGFYHWDLYICFWSLGRLWFFMCLRAGGLSYIIQAIRFNGIPNNL